MIPLALSSGISCILAYGQTGSGKTYTMEALEHRIARDLFIAAGYVGTKLLEAEARAKGDEPTEEATYKDPLDVFEFSVSFMELLGKRGADLLEQADGLPIDDQGNAIRSEVPIREDKVRKFTKSPVVTLMTLFRTGTSDLVLYPRPLRQPRSSTD